METRLVFAYLIIAFMVIAAGSLIGYARYNQHDRKIARQRARERDARVKRIQDIADRTSS
ncbi:hypothetical protein [Tsuneonella rigui]|jgi:hypothetical protein|uniref:hypothetical protein n=1 Tax=Tsuneonella rigui TaxID=1708790 RepID=UPI000F7E9D16|nr:hypothetical protein [Tsuneonella rigui]